MSQPVSSPKVDILLPVKESFQATNAGAVATIVYDLATAGTNLTGITVIGSAVERPFPGINFVGLNPKHIWLNGKSLGFAAAYFDRLKRCQAPDLIEVHGRCNVAAYLLKKRPEIPISLYLHNDPRNMKGAKSIRDRKNLLNKLVQIICVSEYIRKCFLDGLDASATQRSKLQVVQNGVARRLTSPPTKEPIIFIAGRMVPEKGILEAAIALAKILPYYPDWRLVIAGARRFDDVAQGSYEEKIGKAIALLGNQAEMTGFIPISSVRQWQERAAIVACPSLWQEPLGKVVVEALAAGCAVLTTRCGGIPEVAEGRALIIDNPTVSTFCDGFKILLNDGALRRDLQMKAWNDFPFTSEAMANRVDMLRMSAITALNRN